MRRFLAPLVVASLLLSAVHAAEPDHRARAARSVHLGYAAPEADLFYNEMIVDRTTEGSFFMACGFQTGYFGIQDLWGGRRVAIFSVWDDHAAMNPNSVPEDKRVRVLYQAPDVRIGRFGGEGTGAQSFYNLNWQTGKVYRFLLRSQVNSNWTAYTAWIHAGDTNGWKKLATFETIAGGRRMVGLHSFLEDFRRNFQSALEIRRARWGNTWAVDRNGAAFALRRAPYTGDDNPTLTIDAGSAGPMLYLQTGGDTKMTSRLWSQVSRPKGENEKLPENLPK